MKWLIGAVAGLVLSASAANAADQWDMPMAYSGSNYHTQNGKLFAEAVGVCTGRALEIVVHGDGSLVEGEEIKRTVQTGRAPIGERLLSAHQNETALFGFDSVPFLATSFEASDRLWQAAKGKLTEILADQNLVLLYSVPWPPQGIYFKREIGSVADMEGIKFRAYNAATARLAELAKMLPVHVEAAELGQALATGAAEAFISSSATGYDRKVWEHMSHFYDIQAWLPRNYVFVNADSFAALDLQARNCLRSAALLAEVAGTARARELKGWYLAELEANGMNVQMPSERLAADLAEIGAIMSAEWSVAAGADGAAIIAAFEAEFRWSDCPSRRARRNASAGAGRFDRPSSTVKPAWKRGDQAVANAPGRGAQQDSRRWRRALLFSVLEGSATLQVAGNSQTRPAARTSAR